MALTIGMTQTEQIEHEPGEWMTFRRLPAKTLRDLRTAYAREQRNDALATMKSLGTSFKEITEAEKAGAEQVAAVKPDPLNAFDAYDLLYAAIEAWSYDAPVTHANIDALDETTVEWAKRAAGVVCLVVPRAEPAAKNA